MTASSGFSDDHLAEPAGEKIINISHLTEDRIQERGDAPPDDDDSLCMTSSDLFVFKRSQKRRG